ncbi:hypothetical protein BLNAU_21532 [Blattamonas nauphoetae]|uniref:B box-type domain-containing protein n=1 Tax=Blattamonas nauphoetae TaxID=2049346 RepID=A0ABQ9WVM9_9EUKA|nr:hypothetical protein BLNAU_21532 [Blattamonas nauphoetae]
MPPKKKKFTTKDDIENVYLKKRLKPSINRESPEKSSKRSDHIDSQSKAMIQERNRSARTRKPRKDSSTGPSPVLSPHLAMSRIICEHCHCDGASEYCIECDGVLCASCSFWIHKHKTAASHERVDPSLSYSYRSISTCQTHPPQTLQFYCETCKCLCCCVCCGFHQVQPSSDLPLRSSYSSVQPNPTRSSLTNPQSLSIHKDQSSLRSKHPPSVKQIPILSCEILHPPNHSIIPISNYLDSLFTKLRPSYDQIGELKEKVETAKKKKELAKKKIIRERKKEESRLRAEVEAKIKELRKQSKQETSSIQKQLNTYLKQLKVMSDVEKAVKSVSDTHSLVADVVFTQSFPSIQTNLNKLIKKLNPPPPPPITNKAPSQPTSPSPLSPVENDPDTGDDSGAQAESEREQDEDQVNMDDNEDDYESEWDKVSEKLEMEEEASGIESEGNDDADSTISSNPENADWRELVSGLREEPVMMGVRGLTSSSFYNVSRGATRMGQWKGERIGEDDGLEWGQEEEWRGGEEVKERDDGAEEGEGREEEEDELMRESEETSIGRKEVRNKQEKSDEDRGREKKRIVESDRTGREKKKKKSIVSKSKKKGN